MPARCVSITREKRGVGGLLPLPHHHRPRPPLRLPLYLSIAEGRLSAARRRGYCYVDQSSCAGPARMPCRRHHWVDSVSGPGQGRGLAGWLHDPQPLHPPPAFA